jgi:hypothetical protein
LPSHPLFDSPQRFKILLEFRTVSSAERPLQAGRIVEHHVQRTGSTVEQVGRAGTVGIRGKQFPVEHARPVDLRQPDALLREAHRLRALAGAGREFDRWVAGLLADGVGDDLVERPRSRIHATEEVVPGGVAVGGAMVKTGEDGEVITKVGERGERRWEVVVAARCLGKKGILMPAQIGADGHEVFGARGSRRRSGEGFQRRQGDCHAARPEHLSAGKAENCRASRRGSERSHVGLLVGTLLMTHHLSS